MPAGITPTIVCGSSLRRTVWPTMSPRAPNRCRQMPSLSTATRGAPGPSSPAVKPRPSAGLTSSTSKKFALTIAPERLSGRSPPESASVACRNAASPARLRARTRQSRKLAGEASKLFCLVCVFTSVTSTRSSGLANGSGRSSTALTMLKIAALAPTPTAMVSTASRRKPGARLKVRPA